MISGEFVPKGSKFNKHRRFRKADKGLAKNANKLAFKQYGIKSITYGEITSKQIETFRRVITNFFKRQSRPIIRVFPNINVSRKQKNVRMGRGKGEVTYWVYKVKPNRIICEFDSNSIESAKEVTRIVNSKLAFKCKLALNE